MSFKDDMIEDLDVFYDTDEFANIAQYKGSDIPVDTLKEVDTEYMSNHVIKTLTKYVSDIDVGDIFIIGVDSFECINFEHEVDTPETIIHLKRA